MEWKRGDATRAAVCGRLRSGRGGRSIKAFGGPAAGTVHSEQLHRSQDELSGRGKEGNNEVLHFNTVLVVLLAGKKTCAAHLKYRHISISGNSTID